MGQPSVEGLSPRLRGNPIRATAMVLETSLAGLSPRLRGNQLNLDAVGRRRRTGLSPRLRGNPVIVRQVAVGDRSIPAPAGEPRMSCRSTTRCRVYPRACGGTLRGRRRSGQRAARSIPAPAGEPGLQPWSQWASLEVYPRACGGTTNLVAVQRRRSVSWVYPRACGGTAWLP